MTTRHCAVLLTFAVALAGCGGGSSSSSSSSGSGGDGGNGEAAKTPRQILSDTAAALQKVKTYHVEGTQIDADGTTQLAGDVTAGGKAHLRLRNKAGRVEMIITGPQTFMKANAAFWKSQGGAGGQGEQLGKLLGDRWVKAPSSTTGDLKSTLDHLSPSGLAHCVTRTTGTISKRGTERVGGQQVVTLLDKGDKPGSSPGELSIAATGRPLPVRIHQTGPTKPGGPKDALCDDSGHDTTKTSDIRFSRFDAPLAITAPKGAVDLDKLGGSGGGAAPDAATQQKS